MDKENMNSMKKKALAFAAAACAFGMLLSGCGSSNGDSTADKGSNVITAYNSEPQNPLIPGDCNETGGGKPLDLTPPSTPSSSRMVGSSPTAPR